MTDKQKHDLLMEMRPDDATHDIAACMFCTTQASEEETVADDPVAIFTQEQHEQLVASAVEKASVEARATADAEVLSLNERLEAKDASIAELTLKIEELERVSAERDEAIELAELADKRVDEVKAVASFSDEQIDKRKSSWAAMSDDDFGAYLDDIRAVAKATSDEKPKTKFESTRSTAGDEGTELDAINAFFGSNLKSAEQS